jgi:hypothetical protein
MSGRRRVVVAVGCGLMLLTALHPPWIARAVLSRMSFTGFPKVPPTTILDSAMWRIPFAPVYSRPSLDLPVDELARYQGRLTTGDTSAATDWRHRVESIEARANVPDTLRSVWRRDSVPGSRAPTVAFTRTLVSTRFEIDVVRLTIYLLAIATVTMIAVLLLTASSTRGRRQA